MTLAAIRAFAFSPFSRRGWEESPASYEWKSTDALPQYTLAQVAEHTLPSSSWLVILDRVYDVTQFVYKHPGGEHLIAEHVGRDATLSFLGASHSASALQEMEEYCVGVLVEHERLYTKLIPKST